MQRFLLVCLACLVPGLCAIDPAAAQTPPKPPLGT